MKVSRICDGQSAGAGGTLGNAKNLKIRKKNIEEGVVEKQVYHLENLDLEKSKKRGGESNRKSVGGKQQIQKNGKNADFFG